MGLINTIEEIRAYVSVNVSNSIEIIMPDIISAEKYIKAALGIDQYNNLNDAYNATNPNLTNDQQLLLEKVQPALANLAYATFITIGQLDISDAGFRIIVGESHKTAFKWQIDDVKQYFLDKGFEAIDELLTFLEGNKTAYPLWTSSDAYSLTREHFINSAAVFTKLYPIKGSRRTFLALLPILKKVEELTIEPAISTPLYEELKAQILTNAVTVDNQKLLRLLQPAVAHLAIARAIPELGLELGEDAVFVREYISTEGKNQKRPSENLLSLKIGQAEKDGLTYLKRLTDFLQATASETLYAAFFTSPVYRPTSTIIPACPPNQGKIYGLF
jgi:hypothetical protein